MSPPPTNPRSGNGAMPARCVTSGCRKTHKITITIAGSPNGNFTSTWAYPDGDRTEYRKTPLYDIIVSSDIGSEKFEGIRFGPRNKNGKTSVPGLADSQTHKIAWHPSYDPSSNGSAEKGAWIIYGNFLIHDGPDNPRQPFGTAGCVEVAGPSAFSRFNNAILRLSGESDLHDVDGVAVYKKATRPLFTDFPVYTPPGLAPKPNLYI